MASRSRTFNAVVAGSIPARLTNKTKDFTEAFHSLCAHCLCPKPPGPYFADVSQYAQRVALAAEERLCGTGQIRAWFCAR